jgi:hypothetical protein
MVQFVVSLTLPVISTSDHHNVALAQVELRFNAGNYQVSADTVDNDTYSRLCQG